MHDARSRLELFAVLQQRPDGALVAEKYELSFGMARECNVGAWDDNRRPDIAPHSIERNSDLLGHRFRECPNVGVVAPSPQNSGLAAGYKVSRWRSYFLTVLF